MGRPRYEIEFYERSNGRCPALSFLDGLPHKKDIVFVDKALERLEKHGLDLGRPHVGTLRDQIYELRVNIQRGQCRLFFFFYGGRKFIITHGYLKKARKVPDSEINKAIEYRNDYLARKAMG